MSWALQLLIGAMLYAVAHWAFGLPGVAVLLGILVLAELVHDARLYRVEALGGDDRRTTARRLRELEESRDG